MGEAPDIAGMQGVRTASVLCLPSLGQCFYVLKLQFLPYTAALAQASLAFMSCQAGGRDGKLLLWDVSPPASGLQLVSTPLKHKKAHPKVGALTKQSSAPCLIGYPGIGYP